jgi:ligand-binding SRPBCC domain-containing protein
MSLYTFKRSQRIPASIKRFWSFISSPRNLKEITPEYMGFNIVSNDLPHTMYQGMIIRYEVRPLFGLKMNWVTEITSIKEPEYFVEEQRVGPYRLWHHEHHLSPVKGGVLMTDLIHYQPPFRLLGAMANSLVIRRRLDETFDYRKKKIVELWGAFPESPR